MTFSFSFVHERGGLGSMKRIEKFPHLGHSRVENRDGLSMPVGYRPCDY